MNRIISEHIEEIVELCLKYKVSKLYIFGSVLKPEYNISNSDIDFYVEMTPMTPLQKGENLMNLWDALEKLFNRSIDLVTDQPIRNPYFKSELEKTKHLIYDQLGKKISV